MAKNIIITGPESTGKTTLTIALSDQLNISRVDEYAREYLAQLDGRYTLEDVKIMAKTQIKKEQEITLNTTGHMVVDTNMLVYKVWIEEKYNLQLDWIEKEILKTKNDLYLLCDIDMIWEPDPLREHPDLEDRKRIFDIYHNYLITNNFNFKIISGNREERLKKSVEFIHELK